MTPTVRLAAAQFATGTDVAANLDTALRMIETASAERPDVVVLPEFCNHLSVYDSFDHAWSVAIDLDGKWTDRVGAAAARHRMWIQVNCTVRRGPDRITNTNMLFDRVGTLRAANDKTVLMGAEGIHLSPAEQPASLVVSDLVASSGEPPVTIGTYACMDGVVPEVPRTLAVRGARLLLNSLNSFALDEASIHVPVRAAENRAWLVACCKIGPLLPPDRLAEFSTAMGVPPEMLRGAGESQIVRPDGTVVAKGPRDDEAVVVADADLSLSGMARPDGTDVIASRRPALYGALARPTAPADDHPRAERITAAAAELDDVSRLAHDSVDLIVLPELAVDDPEQLRARLEGTECLVVTSIRCDNHGGTAHCGVAVDSTGVIAHAPQLHAVARHSWTSTLGAAVVTVDRPWGRVAVVVGDDVLYPEVPRLAALASADVVAVPWSSGGEPWDVSLCLPERAAENRVCLVSSGAAMMVIDLPPDFTLWAPERTRPFDGTINLPDVIVGDRLAMAEVHPVRSRNRQISRNTDLVDGRPWRLCESLATEN